MDADGSTRYLWKEDEVAQKIAYVIDEQGEPMVSLRFSI